MACMSELFSLFDRRNLRKVSPKDTSDRDKDTADHSYFRKTSDCWAPCTCQHPHTILRDVSHVVFIIFQLMATPSGYPAELSRTVQTPLHIKPPTFFGDQRIVSGYFAPNMRQKQQITQLSLWDIEPRCAAHTKVQGSISLKSTVQKLSKTAEPDHNATQVLPGKLLSSQSDL